jgi:hypothetical protein
MATDMTAEEAAKQLRVEAAASRSRALIDELHREPYWNSLAKEQEAYATLIEQLTARIAELEDLTKVTTDDDRELPGVRCACVIDEDTGKKLQECVPHERLRERAEELEAELANERGIKEQFKSALARQEELDHQEKLEARLAQLEEPDSESVPIAPEIQKEVGRILRERGFPGYQENEQSLIGKVLKQGRIACYVGMREFAERIGIKPSVYAAIERSGVATKEQWQLIAESLCAARAKRTEWVCQQLVQREEPIAESEGGCDDCGRPYASGGFPDLIITKDAWQRISPTGDDGGLLCPSCICQRLHDAGMSQVEGAFMSGPIKSVDLSLMHNIRWVENLRVQGHGWSCPDCGERRAQLTPPAHTEGGET